MNLSSYELSEHEKLALGFGLNFCIAKTPVNFMSVAKGFINLEKHATELPPENVFIAKGCVYSLLNQNMESNFPARFIRALKNLKRNENIHITRADKSNTLVILGKKRLYN